MKFRVGDDVELLVDKSYDGGNDVVKAGTPGVVRKVYPLSTSYRVKFQGHGKERRVPEGDLGRQP